MAALLIAHGSPTLARLKTGSLFRAKATRRQASYWNASLRPKGVALKILKEQDGYLLLYLYRPAMLARDLQKPGVPEFMRRHGYHDLSPEACLKRLKQRLQKEDFPHEIGLFLGYPLADVEGFITHGGRGSKLVGHWKVYGDEQDARRQFAKFDKCTRIYRQLFADGRSIGQLTVPA